QDPALAAGFFVRTEAFDGYVPSTGAVHPVTQQLVLLPGAIAKRIVPVAWDVVVANGTVELTHREVHALSLNSIVEVPGTVDIGLQNLTAHFVVNNEGRHTALSGRRVVALPMARGLDRP